MYFSGALTLCCALLVAHWAVGVDGQSGAAGMSGTFPADVNAQNAANQVINLVQSALGSQLVQYRPISYRSQPVFGGTNFYIKILVQAQNQAAQYVHVRVGQQSNGVSSLNGMELQRALSDPISYIFVKQCQG